MSKKCIKSSKNLRCNSGLRFIPNFQLNEGEIVCGQPASNILLSTFTFTHVKFNGRDEHVPALYKVKKIIDDCHFDGLVFPFSQVDKRYSVKARSCKRSRTLFKSLLFWLVGEVSWLAEEVLSPC